MNCITCDNANMIFLLQPANTDNITVMQAAPRLVKKVKFSHTHHRALGPELIPVYRQSARR